MFVHTLDVSIDQLLTDSLINIDRKAKKPVRSSDFKSSNTSSTSTSEKKTFTESNKSRTWGGVSDEFSGLFAQDVPPTIESQSESITGYHDNSFGEFQSVPISQKPISEHSSGTFSSPVLTHMATPSTQSPQVVHSQFHTPLTLTSQAPSSALSESDLPSWLISAVTYNASQLPPVYYLVYQVRVWTCTCMFIRMSVHLYNYMSICLCTCICFVHVYIYVSMSICMYMYICPFACLFICMYMYTCPFVCTCTSVHLYVHVHLSICMYMHVCSFVCTCTSVHLYVHACLFICMYMYVCSFVCTCMSVH